MRLADFPLRNVRGVSIRDTPNVRNDTAEALPVNACMALDCLRALEAPGDVDWKPSAEWQAIFTSLTPIIEGVDDIDLSALSGADAPRVQAIAHNLARWLDAVWYPKGDTLCDEFNDAYPGVRHRGEVWAHRQVMVFAEEAWRFAAIWGSDTIAARDSAGIATVANDLSTREAVNSPVLMALLERQNRLRLEAVQAVSGVSVADLAAAIVTRPTAAAFKQ